MKFFKDVKEKILFFDIETSHCIALVWGCGKQYVSPDQIVKDRKILTISYMWKGDKKPTVLLMDLNRHDIFSFDDDADKKMLEQFCKVYSKADVVVAHNGRKFDIERLQARLFAHRLPPLAPVLVDDTYTMSKPIGLTSHKLNFISKILGHGSKLKTELQMWIDIIWKKDKKQLEYMGKYNAKDVALLEKDYNAILPYGKSKLNRALLSSGKSCVDCGHEQLQARGYRYTRTGKYRFYVCKNCGSSKTTDRRASEVALVK